MRSFSPARGTPGLRGQAGPSGRLYFYPEHQQGQLRLKAQLLIFPPLLAAKEFREGKLKEKKNHCSVSAAGNLRSQSSVPGNVRDRDLQWGCRSPGQPRRAAAQAPAPADCPFPSVEFGPTDYCTSRVARCHRSLHLAEAF